MSLPGKKVAVVGAGVIGLSVATHLLEKFPDDLVVTIIADKFSPDTISSDRSGGWIFPPGNFSAACPGDPERAVRWMRGSFRRFEELYNSEEASSAGLSLSFGYLEPTTNTVDPDAGYVEAKKALSTEKAEFMLGLRIMPREESLKEVHECDRILLAFTTYMVPCPIYLPWLLKKFTQLGGVTEQRKVHDLSELSSYDIVINCTGLGARELANDQQVYPVLGHIVSVSAPWLKQWLIRRIATKPGESTYIFPRTEEVILGGTFITGKEDLTVDQSIVQGVIERCCKAIPSLAGAEVNSSWAGIRPYRNGGVRLEKDEQREDFVLIHCYGHGGDGVSLSWGCAEEVGTLVERELRMDSN